MKNFLSLAGAVRAVRAAACAVAAVGLLSQPARADVSLYQAAVPLQGATEADRATGFGEALKIAAVRASGRRDAAGNAVITAAAADPSRYVQQYSTTADRMLKVGFDGRGVEQLLQQAGLPLWPAERPMTLVQLFVPSVAGGTRAVLASERCPEREEVEREAQVRGLPIRWPDQPTDAGAARARLASPGPAADAVLVGVVTGSQVSWSFAHLDARAQGQGAPAAGADLAADTLAARYAPASTKGVATVAVRVGGVTDIQAYAGLLEYLQTLSLVRAVAVDEVSGTTVRLDVTLRGDLDLLKRIAALDARLAAAKPDPAGGSEGVDFSWQP